MITVNCISGITGIGKRSGNEDHKGILDKQVFIVCDGVGGSEKGEVASELVVNTFLEGFRKNNSADINDLLQKSDKAISSYIIEHPEANGMASTLTLSQIRTDGILIAWCGDSRVYQFREGKIIFRTTDHSWINDALKAGLITADESVNHPKSNVITRAIQGTHNPAEADIEILKDIKACDLFLHCSDGILESWSETELQSLFAHFSDPVEITFALNEKCSRVSKDNFTAIVYSIEKAELPADLNQKNSDSLGKQKAKQSGTSRKLILISVITLLIFTCLFAFIIYPGYFRKNNESSVAPSEKNKQPPKRPQNTNSQKKNDSVPKNVQNKKPDNEKKGQEANNKKGSNTGGN